VTDTAGTQPQLHERRQKSPEYYERVAKRVTAEKELAACQRKAAKQAERGGPSGLYGAAYYTARAALFQELIDLRKATS